MNYVVGHRTLRCALSILLLSRAVPLSVAEGAEGGKLIRKNRSSSTLSVGDARLQIDVRGVASHVADGAIEEHIQKAAQAVTTYFGRFPVPSAHVVVSVLPGHNDIHGTTWGAVGGYPAVTQLRVGQDVTQAQLDQDWSATHELTHMSLASLPDEQLWLEEGLATYVEPIARAQAGQLSAEHIWSDMVAGMHNGEPGPDDRGMNHTQTWGRTYWGGAMFYLVADVEMRKRTNNARGVQDALRAIVDDGGTIDKEWPVQRLLKIGDKATGTTVLEDLYTRWSDAPVEVDLPTLWSQLGIHVANGKISLDDAAPLAPIRLAITAPRPN